MIELEQSRPSWRPRAGGIATIAVAFTVAVVACVTGAQDAGATAARLSPEDCEQLRADQAKFLATGILEEVDRGPANDGRKLSKARLRDIELFIMLEEQIKFGCRIYPLMTEYVSDEELARRAATEGLVLPLQRDRHLGLPPRRQSDAPKSDAATAAAPNGPEARPPAAQAPVRADATAGQPAAQQAGTPAQHGDTGHAEPLPKWSTMGKNSIGGAIDQLKPTTAP